MFLALPANTNNNIITFIANSQEFRRFLPKVIRFSILESKEGWCARRKLNGEKQQVLAKALSVSVSTVRSWEHDKSSPDHSTLVAICRRYHTSSDFLLGLSDYDPSDKARLQRQRLTEEEQNEMHRYEEYLLWKRKK